MKDPRTVSPEEKERTIKLARQIFANWVQQNFPHAELEEFHRNVEYLSQRPPQPAPKAEPAAQQEPPTKTLESALTVEEAVRQLRAAERRSRR